MNEIPSKTPEERLREKLAAFDEGFQQTVLAYRQAPTPEALPAIVQGVLAHHAGRDALAAGMAEKGEGVRLLEDLSLDSLAMADLSFQAEDFVGIVIQLEDFAGIKTLGDLQTFLRQKAFPSAVGLG